MERSDECHGTDRGTINVTDRISDCKAEVNGVNCDILPRLHLSVHYGYKL